MSVHLRTLAHLSLPWSRAVAVTGSMHRPVRSLVVILLLLVTALFVGAAPGQTVLTEIFQLATTNNTPAWITARQTNLPAFRELEKRTVWLGFVSDDWPPGLVPIYAVERRGLTELRRRPPRGQENFVDPLFYALPGTSETNAFTIAGRWQVRAIGNDGHRHQLTWELTIEGDAVSGRFDQNTEYRFAFIDGGTWRSNRLELLVEYVNEHFALAGELTETNLTGTWRRTDDSRSGTWTAERLGDPLQLGERVELRDLFTWREPGNPALRYGVEPPDASGRWQRAEPLLGRVWRRRSGTATADAAD